MTTPMWQTSFFRRIASFAFAVLFVCSGFVVGVQETQALDVIAADCLRLFGGGCQPTGSGGYIIGVCTDQVGKNCVTGGISESQCQTRSGGACDGGDVDTGGCTRANTKAVAVCDFTFTSDKVCCMNAATPTPPPIICTALNPIGHCSATSCNPSSEDTKTGTDCHGTQPICCTPKAVSGACTALNPAGHCSATSCNPSSEDTKTGTDCHGTQPICCTPKNVTPTPTPPPGGGGSTTTSFTNPLQFNTVQDVLGSLLTTLQGIIVILSIIFIIIGALLYVTSGGSESQIKTAKSAITAAMIGLAIGIAAPSFLKEISTILGWNDVPSNVSNAISLTAILTNVLNFLLGITGILAIIMLIVGALMFLSSAGDENRLDAGKKIVKASIIGIIVTFAALLIVKQIAALFVG